LDNAMIEGGVVPMMWRGTTETWEKEPGVCVAGWGCCWWEKEPTAGASKWLAGWAIPPVWWGKKAAAAESIWERERGGRLQVGRGGEQF
jgi:hypothetical protein